jgi:hypothetical protein
MDNLHAKIREWREKPVSMVRELFQVEPDTWQKEVLEAFPGNQRGALKACKGPGKTAVLAWLGLNFLLTRPHPKVICSSITWDNLKDGLWTEMAKWRAKSPLLTELFEYTGQRIFAKDHPETWWCSARGWARDGDANSQAAAMAGIHGDYVLMLLDEVGDYPEGVFVAAEAALSTGVETKLWCAGNPTRTEGPLYRVCTVDRARWWVKEITGDPDNPDRAKRISVEWARHQIEMWGRDNPWVLVNVFGQFPPTQANKLVGPDEASTAAHRTVEEEQILYAPRVLGVDVARYGDDSSVLILRQGPVAYRPRVFRDLDIMALADQVVQAIQDWQVDGTFIDETGLGAGVVDRVRQLGYTVVGVNFGSTAMEKARFENRRTEMWWKMAQWVKGKGCIPNYPELIAGLTAPSYGFSKNSRLVLESKEEMRRRGQPSPDEADALALTFAYPVFKEFGSVDSRYPIGQIRSALTEYDPMMAKD